MFVGIVIGGNLNDNQNQMQRCLQTDNKKAQYQLSNQIKNSEKKSNNNQTYKIITIKKTLAQYKAILSKGNNRIQHSILSSKTSFFYSMSFQYRKTKQQPSSSLESQGKHTFLAHGNNNYYNKENISYQTSQQYNLYPLNNFYQPLQQHQPLQQQQLLQQLPISKTSNNNSNNIYPNTRRFGRDLSNIQQVQGASIQQHQQILNKKNNNNGSLTNSRCTSRELSVNNRRQTSFITQQQGNNKLNSSVNMVLEKSAGTSNNSRYRGVVPAARLNQVNNPNSGLKMDVENQSSNNVSVQNFFTENSFYFPIPSSTQANQQLQGQNIQTTINTSIGQSLINYNSQTSTSASISQAPQTDYTTEYFNFLQQMENGHSQQNNNIHEQHYQQQQVQHQVNSQQNYYSQQKYTSRRNYPDSRSSMELIDYKYINKPEYVPQYAKEIFEYLRSNEDKHICKTQYFEQGCQPDLNSRMRTILIDWLIDVHLKFDLLPETLFLTVNLIDRYLEKGPKVDKSKFQLVGIAALFIACKYEEIYPPEVKDFTHVCDDAYTKQELFEYEGLILQVLNFNITTPSAFRFLERYARIAEFDQKQFLTALYFLEMALVDYQGTKYTPSQLACGSILISSIIYNKQERWSEALARNTKYEQQQLVPVVEELCEIHRKAELREKQTKDKDKQLNAVKRKFAQPRFESVYAYVALFFQNTNKAAQTHQQNSNNLNTNN
ncbi:hypothetical protein ABPG74_004397 [Tetrahymena malaccensis]